MIDIINDFAGQNRSEVNFGFEIVYEIEIIFGPEIIFDLENVCEGEIVYGIGIDFGIEYGFIRLRFLVQFYPSS